jgi:DNA-3-methyladenine glycosylase II
MTATRAAGSGSGGAGARNDTHVVRTAKRPHDSQLELEPGAPFRLDLTTWVLRRRPHNAVDRWHASTYTRVLCADGGPVALSVTQNGLADVPRLSVRLAGRPIDRSTELFAVSALDRLLGLSVDLSDFATMAAQDPLLSPLASRMRGLRPPRVPTVFEALVNGIACQQLSLAVGIHLLNRLTADLGRPVSDDPGGLRGFPEPADLAPLEPDARNRHGFSMAKARTIIRIARAIVSGELDLEGLEQLDDPAVLERLTRMRGNGRWTAEYVLLRGLGRLHIFPGDDVGAHNKLRRLFDIDTPLDYESVDHLVARWHPHAGIVYFHLLLDSLPQEALIAQP